MEAENKIKTFLNQQKDFSNIQYILCNFKESRYTPFTTVELLRKMYTEAIVAAMEKSPIQNMSQQTSNIVDPKTCKGLLEFLLKILMKMGAKYEKLIIKSISNLTLTRSMRTPGAATTAASPCLCSSSCWGPRWSVKRPRSTCWGTGWLATPSSSTMPLSSRWSSASTSRSS